MQEGLIMQKICSKCKKLLDIKMFNRDIRKKYNVESCCKECKKLYKKENKNILLLKQQERRKNNSEYLLKQKARNLLYSEIRAKRIIKPCICEGCNTENILQAHHFNYNEPLNIIWLCRKCHSVLHRKGDNNEIRSK